jgi:hypothetical protein
MLNQLESPDIQELIKKISQKTGSIFIIVTVQSKLNFSIRTIMNVVLTIEEIVIEIPAFGNAPLVCYTPWRNSAPKTHRQSREIIESLILEIEGKGVKLRHYRRFDLSEESLKIPNLCKLLTGLANSFQSLALTHSEYSDLKDIAVDRWNRIFSFDEFFSLEQRFHRDLSRIETPKILNAVLNDLRLLRKIRYFFQLLGTEKLIPYQTSIF